jgi:hypothetical protein
MTILEIISVTLGILGVINIIRLTIKRSKLITHLQHEVDYCWSILNDPNGVDEDMRSIAFEKAVQTSDHKDANIKIKQQCLDILKECNRLHKEHINYKLLVFQNKWGEELQNYNTMFNHKPNFDINQPGYSPKSIYSRYGLSCTKCGQPQSGCFCLVTQTKVILNNLKQPEEGTNNINR